MADTVTATLRVIEEKLGTSFKKEQVTHWHAIPELVGCSNERFFRLMDEAWSWPWRVPPEERGISEMMYELHRAGHRVMIVTRRTKGSHPFVCNWLDEFNIWFDDLVLQADVTLSKFAFPIDCLVDDAPGAIKEAMESGKTLYLRTQPWNAGILELPRNVKRVPSLGAAVALILGQKDALAEVVEDGRP